jgi:multisubunit Na+/H+ antiporter MnhE subunit
MFIENMILEVAASCGCLALLWLLISGQFSWSRNIYGPRAAKVTKLWYLRQILRSDFHLTNIKLHREKGKAN